MNAYSIEVNNGKIIGDSTFFRIANDLLHKECKRLCDFTDALDKDPLQKKQKIAEYKCAKYRYAAVSLIHSTVYNNNRCRKLHNIEYSHYLLQPLTIPLKILILPFPSLTFPETFFLTLLVLLEKPKIFYK